MKGVCYTILFSTISFGFKKNFRLNASCNNFCFIFIVYFINAYFLLLLKIELYVNLKKIQCFKLFVTYHNQNIYFLFCHNGICFVNASITSRWKLDLKNLHIKKFTVMWLSSVKLYNSHLARSPYKNIMYIGLRKGEGGGCISIHILRLFLLYLFFILGHLSWLLHALKYDLVWKIHISLWTSKFYWHFDDYFCIYSVMLQTILTS